MIRLSREPMEAAFVKYLETVFVHPGIISAGVRNIAISRENQRAAHGPISGRIRSASIGNGSLGDLPRKKSGRKRLKT